MKKIISVLLLLINTAFANKKIWYVPNYTNDGMLNIPHLNNAIFLAELQYDSVDIDFIIPKGTYNIPNDQTIFMRSNVNLIGDSVNFIYKWKSDAYTLDLISFYWIKNSSIKNITLDLRQAFKDKNPSYSNADKYINRSVIQIDGSKNILVDSVKIYKILGCGIELSNSSLCKISNCNIEGSWVYGNESGTQGYGIDVVGTLCQDNIIFNNTLKDMRHNIIIQYGAHHNIIYSNAMFDAKALKKVWFLEVMDKKFTYNLSLHGNGPHNNIIQNNYCDWRLCVDNIKTNGNGPNNQIIGNFVMGLLSVESKAPYDYNSGQVIRNNKFGSLKIEAKNCINEGNVKIK